MLRDPSENCPPLFPHPVFLNPLPYVGVSRPTFPAISCQLAAVSWMSLTLFLPFPGWYWPHCPGPSPQPPPHAHITKLAISTGFQFPVYMFKKCSKWCQQCVQSHHFTSSLSKFSRLIPTKWPHSYCITALSRVLHHTSTLFIPLLLPLHSDRCNRNGPFPRYRERPH